MTLQALPDFVDITNSTSNLAYNDFAGDDFSQGNQVVLFDDGALDGSILRTPVEEYRITWGEDVAALLSMGAYGYQRSGGNIWHALLWSVAGYMAPLPTAGVAALQVIANVGSAPQFSFQRA